MAWSKPATAIFTHTEQGKNYQAISATQLLKMDTRTTEILSFKKICLGLFEIDRFFLFDQMVQKKGRSSYLLSEMGGSAFFSEPFDQIKKVRTFLMQKWPMANNIF